MVKVSVVIPCHNAARWVGETLESAMTQRGVTLQVIVVDDGSTDDSAALVAREFPGVELVRTGNGGQSCARNAGLEHARGELIQFLDADDLLPPDKLLSQGERLQAGDADIVYCDWQRLYQQDDGTTQTGPVIVRALGDEPAVELVRDAWSPPHAYLFRREIVTRAGKFPEDYWFTGDARFVIECALRGAGFVHLDGAPVLYRVHAHQLSQQDPRAFSRERLQSTREVQAWWENHNGISARRHDALVTAYALVARDSYRVEPATFEAAYRALTALEPNYLPPSPPLLRLASRLVGYPHAEALAGMYRQMKRGRAA